MSGQLPARASGATRPAADPAVAMTVARARIRRTGATRVTIRRSAAPAGALQRVGELLRER